VCRCCLSQVPPSQSRSDKYRAMRPNSRSLTLQWLRLPWSPVLSAVHHVRSESAEIVT
jgi:hypothetical protein